MARGAVAFYQAGKAPLVAAFATVLANLKERCLLTCDRPESAARRFVGLIQEFVIWPHVMAVAVEATDAPSVIFRPLKERVDIVAAALVWSVAHHNPMVEAVVSLVEMTT